KPYPSAAAVTQKCFSAASHQESSAGARGTVNWKPPSAALVAQTFFSPSVRQTSTNNSRAPWTGLPPGSSTRPLTATVLSVAFGPGACAGAGCAFGFAALAAAGGSAARAPSDGRVGLPRRAPAPAVSKPADSSTTAAILVFVSSMVTPVP